MHCIFYLTDYIQSSFVFNIVVPTEYLDFFDLGNIGMSVFYMRAQTELVYILQTRVEKGIVYFFERLYSEQFCFQHWGAGIIFRFFSIHVNK